MPYYPIFLDLRGKRVLVAGAGRVALRKIRGLVECGAEITVVAPEGRTEIAALPVHWVRRRYRKADLRGAALAYAATNDRAVNHALALDARRAGIPVNVADSPEECGFFVPARVTRDHLQVAVSTGGENPRLAAALRRKIEAALDEPVE